MTQKEVAIKCMKQLDIFNEYIKSFNQNDKVCLFEGFGGYWLNQFPEIEKKKDEIEKTYGCKVYAVTHEYTEFGELYDFLIVSQYREEWNTMISPYKDSQIVFAFTWCKDYYGDGEFGDIAVKSFGGGIRRVG